MDLFQMTKNTKNSNWIQLFFSMHKSKKIQREIIFVHNFFRIKKNIKKHEYKIFPKSCSLCLREAKETQKNEKPPNYRD